MCGSFVSRLTLYAKRHTMTAKRFTCSVTCLLYALLFGLVVMDRMATPSLAQAQGDPPVEQTRKNIQVLKGLPESQLFPVMNFMSTSLEVKCDYCHVKNGKNASGGDNWVWESDEKKTKLAGRQMIKQQRGSIINSIYGRAPEPVGARLTELAVAGRNSLDSVYGP